MELAVATTVGKGKNETSCTLVTDGEGFVLSDFWVGSFDTVRLWGGEGNAAEDFAGSGCDCRATRRGRENADKDAAFIEGPNGKLYPGFKSDIPNLAEKLAAFPDPAPQVTDFAQAVRTRQKFALNESNGFRSATIINLGKIAVRTRRPLRFDPDKLQFIDDEQANRLIDQPMRDN